jgi:glucokinase
MKRAMTLAGVEMHNLLRLEDQEWKITAADLAKMLAANGMQLVGDGEQFNVVSQ